MSWMIRNAAALREQALERRNRGFGSGKAAAGWNAKRPDPAKGSWDRLRAETKAKLRDHWAEVLAEYQAAAFPERFNDIPF